MLAQIIGLIVGFIIFVGTVLLAMIIIRRFQATSQLAGLPQATGGLRISPNE